MDDNEVLPTLLNPLQQKIQQGSAAEAYDTRTCHQILKNKGITPTILHRSNAGYWETGYPKNEAVKAL